MLSFDDKLENLGNLSFNSKKGMNVHRISQEVSNRIPKRTDAWGGTLQTHPQSAVSIGFALFRYREQVKAKTIQH